MQAVEVNTSGTGNERFDLLASRLSVLELMDWQTDWRNFSQSPVLQEAAAPAENEDIHYRDIDFSVARAGPSSDSEQDGTEQQQVAVYSQFNMFQAGHSQCVYAPVKKK